MWWHRCKPSTTVNPSLDVGHRIGRGLPNDEDTSTKRTHTEDWTDKGINTRESNAQQTPNSPSLHSVTECPSLSLHLWSKKTIQWLVHRYLNWVQEYQIVTAHVTGLSNEFYEWQLLNVHWNLNCAQKMFVDDIQGVPFTHVCINFCQEL